MDENYYRNSCKPGTLTQIPRKFCLNVFYFISIWLENHEGYIPMNHTITCDIHTKCQQYIKSQTH